MLVQLHHGVNLPSWFSPAAHTLFWTDCQSKLVLVQSLLSSQPITSLIRLLFRILKYVKGAVGETDVPDALPEFISQRRRWLNGSFFAATYAIAHVGQILRSGHSFARKVTFMVETVYNIVNLIFAWFSIVSQAAIWKGSIWLKLPSGEFLCLLRGFFPFPIIL